KIERAKLAKQRQKEEEEREAAAKAERLRAKLAALGPSPEPKVPSSAVSPSQPSAMLLQTSASVSPPKPPVPTTDGEIAQYGMIKVHQAHPLRKSPPGESITAPTPQNLVSEPAIPNNIGQSTISQPAEEKIHRLQDTSKPSVQLPQNEGPRERNLAPTQREAASWAPQTSAPTPEAYSWGNAQAHVKSSNNVWGPPSNNNRSLGNGTFDGMHHSRQFHSQNLPAHPQSSHSPGPIAPPATSTKSPFAQPALPAQNFLTDTTHNNLSAHQEHHNELSSQQLPSHLSNHTSPNMLAVAQPTPPGPIAPPAVKRWSTSDWQKLPSQLAIDDKESAARARAAYASNANRTIQPENAYRQTFRRTILDPNAPHGRRIVQTEEITHGEAPQAEEAAAEAVVSGLQTPANGAHSITQTPLLASQLTSSSADDLAVTKPIGSERAQRPTPAATAPPAPVTAGRGTSRFFSQGKEVSQPTSVAAGSPPPPETQSHPVLESDTTHAPVVKLPKKPIVKLPPVQAAEPQPIPQPSLSLRVGAQPIVTNSEWQRKFNALTGKAPAAVTSPALSVEKPSYPVRSVSRTPLDVVSKDAATVSLPQNATISTKRQLFSNDTSSDVTSRAMAEDLFGDELTFGSLPKVKIPSAITLNAHDPKPLLTSRPNSRLGFVVQPEVTTNANAPTEISLFLSEHNQQGFVIKIHLPGQETTNSAVLRTPKSRNASGYTKKSSGNNGGERTAPRSRNPSNNFKTVQGSSQPSSPKTARPNTYNNKRTVSGPNNFSKQHTASGVVH
ncbi:hypothetical protein LTS18_008384, partial [Coniosporium uncinatum]